MCAARDKKPGFDSEFSGEVLRFKLRGEIDHHSAAAIRCAMDEMIRAKRPRSLEIDMSAVDFMDSSGLGLIMGRYAVMKELGGETAVVDPSPRAEKIMTLAGLERIVTVRRTKKAEDSQASASAAHGRAKKAKSRQKKDGDVK